MITATEARKIAMTIEENQVGESLPSVMRKIHDEAHKGNLSTDYYTPNWWSDRQYQLMADKLKEYGYTVRIQTRHIHIEW